MTGCIYHEADLDGVMSAAIVKKYFKGDIDLLPYNYGKEIPDVNKYDKVFVVDVSFGDRTIFLFDEAAAGFQLSVEDMMGFLKERRI